MQLAPQLLVALACSVAKEMRDAILGGLVVAVIDNGMGLLGYAAGIKFIVTGAVLLVSAGVDAVSRRGSSV